MTEQVHVFHDLFSSFGFAAEAVIYFRCVYRDSRTQLRRAFRQRPTPKVNFKEAQRWYSSQPTAINIRLSTPIYRGIDDGKPDWSYSALILGLRCALAIHVVTSVWAGQTLGRSTVEQQYTWSIASRDKRFTLQYCRIPPTHHALVMLGMLRAQSPIIPSQFI